MTFKHHQSFSSELRLPEVLNPKEPILSVRNSWGKKEKKSSNKGTIAAASHRASSTTK
jgi:hypothetical protein